MRLRNETKLLHVYFPTFYKVHHLQVSVYFVFGKVLFQNLTLQIASREGWCAHSTAVTERWQERAEKQHRHGTKNHQTGLCAQSTTRRGSHTRRGPGGPTTLQLTSGAAGRAAPRHDRPSVSGLKAPGLGKKAPPTRRPRPRARFPSPTSHTPCSRRRSVHGRSPLGPHHTL